MEPKQPQAHNGNLVVIGSSAGGIDALSKFVGKVPEDFAAAIVIAQHMDPRHASHLQSILDSASSVPVVTVTEKAALQRGTVYVVPANRNVVITDHDVGLEPTDGGSKPSIDLLFSSAARAFQERLVAVVLTGTGSDGSTGAQEVKRFGGTVIIQDPETAEFPELPLSVSAAMVDLVLPTEEMPGKIQAILADPSEVASDESTLADLLRMVEERSAIDFSHYKRPTILRRLQRRMVASDKATIQEYLAHLRDEPEEYTRLVDNFLIKVTNFFRDRELFDVLRDQILPAIVERARGRDREIRVWSAGCATGEEPYSIAVLLAEILGEDAGQFEVKIFATDLDASAIGFARHGVYPESALESVPHDLVARYFTRIGREYQVRKSIRSMVLLGQHDLGDRPPFPRIDLVVCRNVLIYFGPELQRHVLRLFAFSLREGGHLVLGKSEAVTALADYFSVENSQLRIFERLPGSRRPATVPLSSRHKVTDQWATPRDGSVNRPAHMGPRDKVGGPAEGMTRWLPGINKIPQGIVVVDRRYNIQYINLAARRLLGVYGLAIGDDLVHLAQHCPNGQLRPPLERMFRDLEPTELSELEYFEPLSSDTRHLRATFVPYETGLDGRSEPYALVTLEDVTVYEERLEAIRQESRAAIMQNEQAAIQLRNLTDVIADIGRANEELTAENLELRGANEEFLVGTEELQAASEEVDTLNEELQASNEELETLNEELQATVEELHATNEDLNARGNELQHVADTLEEARRTSESERARLEAILVSMADGVVLLNKDQSPVLTNESFRAHFGNDGIPAVALDASGNLIEHDARPEVRAAQGESFSMEFAANRGNGQRAYYEVIGRPVKTDGQFDGGLLVVRDITDRSIKRLQDEFLAIASHELRTPLTVLRGYLALLHRGAYEAGRVKEIVGLANDQALRIERLTYDLLDVVRLETGQLSLYKTRLDLNDVTARCVRAVELLYPDRSFIHKQAGKAVIINADSDRIEQVFLNILLNATQFTPIEGTVEIAVRRRGDTGVVTVKDSGSGIDPNDLNNIFSRFFRSQSARQAQVGGLGLGLYITRELVEAHGGAVEASSDPGQGATFIVRIPLADNNPVEEPGQPSARER